MSEKSCLVLAEESVCKKPDWSTDRRGCMKMSTSFGFLRMRVAQKEELSGDVLLSRTKTRLGLQCKTSFRSYPLTLDT